MAKPMGSKRAFSSSPAAIAAAAPPPAASTLSAANCAAPANTTSDITIGATEPITGCASTPNETPEGERRRARAAARPASPCGVAVLVPSRYLTS